MNREEEIKQAIKDICGCNYCKFDKDYCPFCKERNVSIEAINWADQYPRKRLVDIEKVIEYMKKNSRFKYLLETDWEILEDLRKAMED